MWGLRLKKRNKRDKDEDAFFFHFYEILKDEQII